MIPILFAFLAGLASACAFAPLSIGPLMIAGFCALLLLLGRAETMRRALALGWAFGFGQFVLGLNWIATAFTFQAAMPASLGWVAVVLLSAYLAVYPAMAAGLAWRYGGGRLKAPAAEGGWNASEGRRSQLQLGLLLAAAWMVTEWLRGTMFTGFAWNPVGVSLLTTPLAQLSPFVGTYGLSAIVVLGGAVFALAFTREHAAKRQGAWLALVLAAATVTGWLRDDPAPAGTRMARVVQPNIGQQNKHNPAFDQETYRRLIGLTGEPANEPRLVFWPEAAIPDFLEDEPAPRRRLARLLAPRDVLLTGGTKIERDAAGAPVGGRNSLYVVMPDGRLPARYDKAHLVPYGEYLPARPILSAIGLSRLVPGDLDFWPGPGPRTLPVPGYGRMGVQICYEIVFSGHVVDRDDRPDFLFNPSNDAWFGRWGPPQHLAQAQLRAAEEGMPVIRSTPTGISAVIDARGRLLASLPWQKAGRIDALIPGPLPPTPFARFGNLLSFAFAALLVAAAWLARRRHLPA
ncbi:MAG TPA: apolipoprotein N-acyltransferase [Sphingomonadaceae bacterium]|nr:apolipoprotein N-acyltransferase [Sphingomonadaceae bacterium]